MKKKFRYLCLIGVSLLTLTSCDLLDNIFNNSSTNTTSSSSTPNTSLPDVDSNTFKIENDSVINTRYSKLETKPTEFTMYSINDLHGKVEKETGVYSGVAQLLYAIENDVDYDPNTSLIIASGDIYQGSGVSNYYKGTTVRDSLQYFPIVSNTIGNHEFDWGRESLEYLATSAMSVPNGYVTLGANITDKNGNKLTNVYNSTIIDRGNFKVGVIGVIDDLKNSISQIALDGAQFDLDPNIVKNEFDKLKNDYNCDIVVVSGHAGAPIDDGSASTSSYTKTLFETIPELNAFFGGHTHQKVAQEYKTNRYYVQAGADSNAYAKIKFTLTNSEYIPTSYSYQVSYIYNDLPDSAFNKDLVDYVNKIDTSALNRVIGKCDYTLARYPQGDELSLYTFTTKAMVKVFQKYYPNIKKPVIAIHNTGGFRADIQKGEITYSDILTVFPFDNYLVYLDDKTDTQLFRQSYGNSSNTYYTTNDFTSSYKVNRIAVTIDYLTTNPSFPDLYREDGGSRFENGPLFMRDLLVEYIEKDLKGVISIEDCM